MTSILLTSTSKALAITFLPIGVSDPVINAQQPDWRNIRIGNYKFYLDE